MQKHDTQEQALAVVADALARAQVDGRWMVAVWSVNADNRLQLATRTTFNFPIADYDMATRRLIETMREETQPPSPPRDRLPAAELPPLAE